MSFPTLDTAGVLRKILLSYNLQLFQMCLEIVSVEYHQYGGPVALQEEEFECPGVSISFYKCSLNHLINIFSLTAVSTVVARAARSIFRAAT